MPQQMGGTEKKVRTAPQYSKKNSPCRQQLNSRAPAVATRKRKRGERIDDDVEENKKIQQNKLLH